MANLIDSAKNQIHEIIIKAYAAAAEKGVLPGGIELAGNVEIPKDASNGDYAATHALAAAKDLKRSPRQIAEALSAEFQLDGCYFDRFEIAGPGFINFFLGESWYRDVMSAVEEEGKKYGGSDEGAGQKVMVEFVSANPTGPMTIGNARGGVLGDVLASVLERAGYDVRREFYLNDTGNQVDLFGRSIEARYMQICLGEDSVEFPENGYKGEDIKDLAQLIYEKHGRELLDMPEEERRDMMVGFSLPINISRMKSDLERYRIHFDEWFYESSLHNSGYVAETVELLTANGLTYENDGAIWLKNIELGADKDEVLRRANGFYTYYAVDIAYHRNKFIERGFDRVIDVWGADHHGHAIRFKSTISAPALGMDADKLDFLVYQMVRLTRDGETVKVSKRTGRALTLGNLMDEIPVDSCRFYFNTRPDTHLEFDLDLAIRQDSENPVYYVQYAHARICTMINALTESGEKIRGMSEIDTDKISSPVERDLIKQISLLPEEIKLAAHEYDPSRINRYVFELAARFHRFYNACRIKGEPPEILSARLKLSDAVRTVISNCLDIIGITSPEKM